MDEKIIKTNKRIFRPRARIMRTLGNELISSETVALIELVKNAYDADATRVTVSFIGPLIEGKGKIIIADNGLGMTSDTILNTWMEPATEYRKRQRRSEYLNRRVVGEKGIGRFAASKLAQSFSMCSRRINTENETHVFFNWDQFDDVNKYLDQIEINWEVYNPKNITTGGLLSQLINIDDKFSEKINHGTILELESLTSNWDEQKIILLRQGLGRLISPFRSLQNINPSDEFEIILDLPKEYQKYCGQVSIPQTLQVPHYYLTGKVSNDGGYSIKIVLKGEEPVLINQQSVFNNERKSTCGPFNIELRAWDRDIESLKESIEKSPGTITDFRRDLDVLSGINIFRDGFRVLPYGETRNDWLRLDIRRVQNPTKNLSNNQIIGYVSITSEENPELRDQSNREGIIESQAFDDFRTIILSILTDLEGKRFQKRHPKAKREETGIFSKINLNTIAAYVRKNYPQDKKLLSVINDNKNQLKRGVDEVQTVLSRYWRLATLGHLIDIVLHDGRTPLTVVKNELAILAQKFKNIELENNKKITSIEKSFELLINQANILSTVFNRIEPFSGRKRADPEILILEKVIADAFAVLTSEIEQIGVNIILPNSKTNFYLEPSEIQEVIINLLNNSLYWLRKVPRDNREIIVQISEKTENTATILFSDSGPGIPGEFKDFIFDPYFSLKSDGVGLGLTIVGNIITEYYYGELELLESGPLPGATFRIKMGWRE